MEDEEIPKGCYWSLFGAYIAFCWIPSIWGGYEWLGISHFIVVAGSIGMWIEGKIGGDTGFGGGDGGIGGF